MTPHSKGAGSNPGLGARFVIFAALFLLLGSLAQCAYRFTLPTDGWSVDTIDVENSNLYCSENLVGAPSGLRPDDTLLEVAGVDVRAYSQRDLLSRPALWQMGSAVDMLVRRCIPPGGMSDCAGIHLEDPVARWTASAVWKDVHSGSRIPELVSMLAVTFVGWFTLLKRPEEWSARRCSSSVPRTAPP